MLMRHCLRDTVEGTLKGWDQLLNLVLDDIEELLVGASSKQAYERYFFR